MSEENPRDGQVREAAPGEQLPTYTCDWGECNRVAHKLRYSAVDRNWLAVCCQCAEKPVSVDE